MTSSLPNVLDNNEGNNADNLLTYLLYNDSDDDILTTHPSLAGGRRRILRNGNLIIDPVSREDRGNYSCTAQNVYGSDTSHGWMEVLRELMYQLLVRTMMYWL